MSEVQAHSDSRPKILIVDDDEAVLNQMRWGLSSDYQVFFTGDMKQAVELATQELPDVITLDLAVKDNDPDTGFSLLDQFVSHDPHVKVVMVTGHDDKEYGIRAMERGAFDFFAKPVNLDELRVLVGRAVMIRNLERENVVLRRRLSEGGGLGGLIGRSTEIMQVFQMIKKVAPTDVTVLVTGESGTGKELVAREIHRLSQRSDSPFISISCGSIPDQLLESELFGHEKGAFTSAHTARVGRLEMADGGTVFLDEIGEMPGPLQVKILRFLQEREIERVGGRRVIPLDVRVVAATNRNLKEDVKQKVFRDDLFYRLSVVNIELPPLQKRPQDIVPLAQEFLERYSADFNRGKLKFNRKALEALQQHPWPGNVRELEHRVQRAVVLSSGRVVQPGDLELSGVASEASTTLRAAREGAERRVIEDALRRSCGNVARAARDLEVSRPTLHDLIRKFDLKATDFKDGIGPETEFKEGKAG